MTLYTAARPLPVIAQQLLWLAARATAGRTARGEVRRWSPPLREAAMDHLWTEVGKLAGAHADGIAVYERLQADRAALTFLYCAGPASLLVRVRPSPAELDAELRVSRAFAARPATSFQVPALAGSGEIDGWHWTAHQAIAARPHRPVRRPPIRLFDEVGDLVERILPRPASVPAHWRGAHGDVTPWNLRRSGDARWLIDWEDAGYAPPGADFVYFEAVRAAIGRGRSRACGERYAEAREYWREVVGRRAVAPVERKLAARLRAALAEPGVR
jgi:hypothetical protein